MMDPGGSGSRACSLKCFLFSSTLQLTRSCLITDTASSGLQPGEKGNDYHARMFFSYITFERERGGNSWRKDKA